MELTDVNGFPPSLLDVLVNPDNVNQNIFYTLRKRQISTTAVRKTSPKHALVILFGSTLAKNRKEQYI